jgi:two-component system NtrC family sensor kinase
MDPNPSLEPAGRPSDFPHYRRAWNRVVVSLLAVAFVPLLAVGGGMYGYAYHQLERKTHAALAAAVVRHEVSIDQFLEERIHDLEVLAGIFGRDQLATQTVLDKVFAELHQRRPCFQDLGVIDSSGRHLAYNGPYKLMSHNYRQAAWFAPVMRDGRYISDVYSGFRDVPHFIIAIRQTDPHGDWILRATMDPAFFQNLVHAFAGADHQDTFLVNAQGLLQSLPQSGGRLMTPAGGGAPERFEGVRFQRDGDRLLAQVWLQQVPWLCVVEMSRGRILADLHRVRTIGSGVLLLSAFLIVATVLLTTNYLVTELETARRNINLLDRQLRRTSYLASTMQLSYGMLHELGDVLHNIQMAQRWLSEASADWPGTRSAEPLAQIGHETTRGRKALERFLRFTAAEDPVITDFGIHRILDDLVQILERDLRLRRIKVERHYHPADVRVRSDRGKLRQIFQNIVLNAMDAIDQDGTLTLSTTADDREVRITISDTGPGVPAALRDRIFEPLFTTKETGTGLGLSLSQNIVQRIGGRLQLDPWTRQSAAFSVVLPMGLHRSDR